MIEQLFFELIRVAIGTQETLSRPPSKVEWAELYAMSKKQSLVGICFSAVQKLTNNQEPRTQNLDEVQYLTWMGMAAKIQQRNETVNRQCVELQAKLSADGIRSSILKGQGVATLYGEQLKNLRQSGDIDIYVDCGREKAIEYARKQQSDVDWDYKHLHLRIFPDTEVEMHYVPEVMSNLWTNRKLRKWYADPETAKSMFQLSGELVTPSIEFNLVYILLHAYRHFLYEGVGLRQLMDYYFVLHTSYENQNENENFVRLLNIFGMMRFAKGIMWIMAHVFANENDDDRSALPLGSCKNDNLFLGIKPDETEGRYIMEQVMRGGNFGHHDERLKHSGKGNWKVEDVKRRLRHACHLFWHYPGEVIWAPLYIVWHKAWMILHRR